MQLKGIFLLTFGIIDSKEYVVLNKKKNITIIHGNCSKLFQNMTLDITNITNKYSISNIYI